MKNNLFRKGFDLVIVVLFIGVTLLPNISGNTQNSGPMRNVFNEINGIIEKKNVCDELKSIVDINAQLFDVYEIMDFGQTAYGLTSADFNGDGNIDFAVASATCPFTHSTISIFYNNGDLEFIQEDVFTFSYSYIESLDSGDYDNDGDIDLIFSYSPYIYYQGMYVKVYGVVSMLFNDDENHFGNGPVIAKRGSGIPYDPEERCNPKVTSADYDGDGDIDLLVGDNSGKVEFYLNNGTRNFTSARVINDWGLSKLGGNLSGL